MTTYELTSKSGDTVQLYTDDTFTLAIGDPETESEETTPELLAECFAHDELAKLAATIKAESSEHEYWAVMDDYSGKLAKALALAA